MNIFYKVFSLLALSALCLNTNPVKAGVCFVVGGDCGEINQVREDKNCLDLGYKYVTDADCVNDNPMYAVVDKDSASCVQNRITYYKLCKCDTSKYKWQTENVGSNYEIVSSPKCHDSNGDHYQYRKCNTSTFKKMKFTLPNTEAVAGVVSQISRCLNTLDGVMCHANSTPTGECSQDSDYISTLNLSNDRCYMDVAKKYKKCICDTSTYKYHDSLSTAFAVDGDYCIGNASNKLNVIDISGRIPYLNGELTLYSGIKCSGKTSGLGTWQKESCGDGYKQTDKQTLDGLTCRVCEPDPCDVGYTYASGATECSTLFGAGTQCVQKAPKNSASGVCLRKATCDDLGSVNLVGGTYVGTASISSSNVAVSGYSSPSSTYDGTSLVYHAKSGVSITGMAEPQGLTVSKNGNEAISLSFNDQTCYWSQKSKCSGDYNLEACPDDKICLHRITNGFTCYREINCEVVLEYKSSNGYGTTIITKCVAIDNLSSEIFDHINSDGKPLQMNIVLSVDENNIKVLNLGSSGVIGNFANAPGGTPAKSDILNAKSTIIRYRNKVSEILGANLYKDGRYPLGMLDYSTTKELKNWIKNPTTDECLPFSYKLGFWAGNDLCYIYNNDIKCYTPDYINYSYASGMAPSVCRTEYYDMANNYVIGNTAMSSYTLCIGGAGTDIQNTCQKKYGLTCTQRKYDQTGFELPQVGEKYYLKSMTKRIDVYIE